MEMRDTTGAGARSNVVRTPVVDARIEGENAGKPFAVDFNYRRSSNNLASRCGAVK